MDALFSDALKIGERTVSRISELRRRCGHEQEARARGRSDDAHYNCTSVMNLNFREFEFSRIYIISSVKL